MGGQAAGWLWLLWQTAKHLPGERQLQPPVGTSPPTPVREHRQRRLLLLLHPLPSLSSLFWAFVSTRLPELCCAVQRRLRPDTSLTAPHSPAPARLPRRQGSPVPSADAPHRSPGPVQHGSTAGPALGTVVAAQQGLPPGSLARRGTGREPMDLEEPMLALRQLASSAGPQLDPPRSLGTAPVPGKHGVRREQKCQARHALRAGGKACSSFGVRSS